MISKVTPGSVRSRGLMVLPAGAFVVHQLRYVLAYGHRADAQLAAQGHSYLDSFAPWLVLLLCLGAGRALARAAGRRRRFGTVWLGASGGLLGIYVVQELLEGFFAVGHPGGLPGVFGHGGWWAVPLSVAVGAAIAMVMRVVADAADSLATMQAPDRVPAALPAWVRLSSHVGRPRPLAGAHAGRAPPLSFA